MSDVLTEQPHLDGSRRATRGTGPRPTGGRARAQRATSGDDATVAAAAAVPDDADTAARAAKTTARALTSSGAPALTVGDRIEVRRRFDEEWASGFELAEAVEGGYRVRRRSDGEVLPAVFAAEAVRAERRRRRNMWWY